MNKRCECGCCDGIEALTPSPTRNRPGLPALRYRVGTHATFLETMEARLSSADFPELRGLTTRAADDPAMALLDAWATVADVLTFYQERIVNEGYLRTATERRSVLELARLVGYALRPGVAASVFLAFTMEQNHQATIPAGARSQSLPGPGELPQSFETSDDLDARAEWNTLRPRLTRPAQLTLTKPAGGGASINAKVLYFQGVATGLKAGDRLLFVFGDKSGDAIVRHVAQVEAQAADSRTKITLQEIPTLVPLETPASGRTEVKVAPQINAISTLGLLREPLARAPALHPANQFRLNRDIRQTLGASGDLIPQLLGVVDPSLQTTIYQAWGHATVTVSAPVSIYALRATAALFGHNVLPPKPPDPQINRVAPHHALAVAAAGETADWSPADDEASDTLFLDNAYDQVLTGSHIVVQRPDQADPQIFLDVTAAERPRTAYGITANTTKITLEGSSWWQPRIQGNTPADPSTPFTAVRGTVVYAQSDLLALADQPIDPIDEPVTGSDVELSGVFGGLRAGRWLIVVGERTDILDGQGLVVPGIRGAELVMLGGVTHDAGTIPGDTIHTTVSFSHDLAYTYKLDTVAIYGNVVNATHGETRNEVLGSGNPAMVRQQFALRQSPLTFVSSATPAGCSSTLDVRVDGILWHEVESVGELSAQSRGFITRTDDDNQTTVIFGDGKRGARPPSGVENIKGTYRTGIGEVGNVKAEQITLLVTRPLGLKKVINPIVASGGADRETRDSARGNAPLAVMALDRLVSVIDYEFFSRTFAGIGKASAVKLADQARETVHVTIAGVNDAPIGPLSDLFINLNLALRQYGDPALPVLVATRELVLLVISAKVRLDPDYEWELVEPVVRAALLEAFGFERRALGQSVFLSEVIATMQAVAGVVAVDVNLFDGIPESIIIQPDQLAARLQALADGSLVPGFIPLDVVRASLARVNRDPAADPNGPRPIDAAELALLSPSVPATLTLTEWTTS